MANFTYRGVVGGGSPEERVFDVVAGTTASIAAGDVVVVADGYAALVSNGGGTTGQRLGLAQNASNETASVAGTVLVQFAPQGLIVRGKATTPANLATALKFDKVTIDVSGTTVTIDENDTSSGACTLWDFIGTDYTTTGVVDAVLPFNMY